MESDGIIKIEGEGHLINKKSNKRFPVKFEVRQIHTGKISGKCMLSGFKCEDVLSPSQLKKCRCMSGGLIKIREYEMYECILENFRNSSLKGKTKNQDEVVIKDIFTYGCTINHSASILYIKFSAGKAEVSYETISTKDQLWIKYGIINLDLPHLLRGHGETDIGKITLSTCKDHNEVIKKMITFKTPLLSGFINIKDTNMGQFESFDSYFNALDENIGKVLELLSLAQSTYLSHCRICIYTKTPNSNSQDDYKLKKLIMLDAKTKAPSLGQPLIKCGEDLYKFISIRTLQKYTDLREKSDLNIAFEWYLESLSHGVIQSKYLLACTCLELLKDRHNKKIGNEYILPEVMFEEYLPDLKNQINEVLKEKEVNNGKRKKISGNLKGINRTIFKNSLLRLLNDYHMLYNDLFLDIQKIIDNRNKITHSGIHEGEFEELFDIYEKLISLIQRIFLTVLEYDGYFLDRNDGDKRKKFTDFTSDEFAQTPQKTLRGENGP